MAAKKLYWLKIKDDFFADRNIKKLRKIAGGDTYTIIYLKMMLLSLKNEGKILYEGVEDTFAEEMALVLDETTENVEVTINFLMKAGLIEQQDSEQFFMTAIPESIGSETQKAAIMRRKRAREKSLCVANGNNVTAELPPVTNCYTEKEIDIEIEKEIERIDYQQIADMYNEICISFPKVKTLSAARKKAIKARLNTYSVDDFKNLFQKAEASDFLKGRNSRDWSANFDWLIKDASMAKVLDGNYDNKGYSESKAPVSAGVDYGVFNKNQSPVTLSEDEYF